MVQVIHVIVKAHPKRPTSIVSVADNGDMTVTIGTLPIMGKANKLLLVLLAKYFQVAPSQIVILKGHQSNKKVIQVSK